MRNILRWLILAIITIIVSMFCTREHVETATVDTVMSVVAADSCTTDAPVVVGATETLTVNEGNTVMVDSNMETIATEAWESVSSALTHDIPLSGDNDNGQNDDYPIECDADHLNNTITGGKYRQIGCVKKGRRSGRARRILRYRECNVSVVKIVKRGLKFALCAILIPVFLVIMLFTRTNSTPDQTVVLTSGTGISATGTYPNFTITNIGDLSTTNELNTGATANVVEDVEVETKVSSVVDTKVSKMATRLENRRVAARIANADLLVAVLAKKSNLKKSLSYWNVERINLGQDAILSKISNIEEQIAGWNARICNPIFEGDVEYSTRQLKRATLALSFANNELVKIEKRSALIESNIETLSNQIAMLEKEELRLRNALGSVDYVILVIIVLAIILVSICIAHPYLIGFVIAEVAIIAAIKKTGGIWNLILSFYPMPRSVMDIKSIMDCRKVISAFGYALKFVDMVILDGECNHGNRTIYIRKDMDTFNTMTTLLHEIGHMIMDNNIEKDTSTALDEVVAEGVANYHTHTLLDDDRRMLLSVKRWVRVRSTYVSVDDDLNNMFNINDAQDIVNYICHSDLNKLAANKLPYDITKELGNRYSIAEDNKFTPFTIPDHLWNIIGGKEYVTKRYRATNLTDGINGIAFSIKNSIKIVRIVHTGINQYDLSILTHGFRPSPVMDDGNNIDYRGLTYNRICVDKLNELLDEKLTTYNTKLNRAERILIPEFLLDNKVFDARKYGMKDLYKAINATQFIGVGTNTSSTRLYKLLFASKELANTGQYTKDDRVFVSINGDRKDRVGIGAIVDLLLAAINAGAIIITDDRYNRSRKYNIGEREVANMLISHNYVETRANGFSIWNKLEEVTPSTTIDNIIVTKKEKPMTTEEMAELKDYFRKNPNKITLQLDKMERLAIFARETTVFKWLFNKMNRDLKINMVGDYSFFDLCSINIGKDMGKLFKRIRRAFTGHNNTYVGDIVNRSYELLPMYINGANQLHMIRFEIITFDINGKVYTYAYLSNDNNKKDLDWLRSVTDGQSLISQRMVADILDERIKVTNYDSLSKKEIETMKKRYFMDRFNGKGDITVFSPAGMCKGHYVITNTRKLWNNWDLIDFDPKTEIRFKDEVNWVWVGFGTPTHIKNGQLDKMSKDVLFESNEALDTLIKHIITILFNKCRDDQRNFFNNLEETANRILEGDSSEYLRSVMSVNEEYIKSICPDMEGASERANYYMRVLVLYSTINDKNFNELVKLIGGGNKVSIPFANPDAVHNFGVRVYPAADPDEPVMIDTFIKILNRTLSFECVGEIHVGIYAATAREKKHNIAVCREAALWRTPISEGEVWVDGCITVNSETINRKFVLINSIAAIELAKMYDIPLPSWINSLHTSKHSAVMYVDCNELVNIMNHLGDGDRDDAIYALTNPMLIKHINKVQPPVTVMETSAPKISDALVGYNMDELSTTDILHICSMYWRHMLGDTKCVGFGIGLLANSVYLARKMRREFDLFNNARNKLIKSIKATIDVDKLYDNMNYIVDNTKGIFLADGKKNSVYYTKEYLANYQRIMTYVCRIMIISPNYDFTSIKFGDIDHIIGRLVDIYYKTKGNRYNDESFYNRHNMEQSSKITTNYIYFSNMVSQIYTGIFLFGDDFRELVHYVSRINASNMVDYIEAGAYSAFSTVIAKTQAMNYVGVAPISDCRSIADMYLKWGGINYDAILSVDGKPVNMNINTRSDDRRNMRMHIISRFATSIVKAKFAYPVVDRYAIAMLGNNDENSVWAVANTLINRQNMMLSHFVNMMIPDRMTIISPIFENIESSCANGKAFFLMQNNGVKYYAITNKKTNMVTYGAANNHPCVSIVGLGEDFAKMTFDEATKYINQNSALYPNYCAFQMNMAGSRLNNVPSGNYTTERLLAIGGKSVAISDRPYFICPGNNGDNIFTMASMAAGTVLEDGTTVYKVVGSYLRKKIHANGKDHYVPINIAKLIRDIKKGDVYKAETDEDVKKIVGDLMKNNIISDKYIKMMVNDIEKKQYSPLEYRQYTFFKELKETLYDLLQDAQLDYIDTEVKHTIDKVIIPLLGFRSSKGDDFISMIFGDRRIDKYIYDYTYGIKVDPETKEKSVAIFNNSFINREAWAKMDRRMQLVTLLYMGEIANCRKHPDHLDDIANSGAYIRRRNIVNLDNPDSYYPSGFPTIETAARYNERTDEMDQLRNCYVSYTGGAISLWANIIYALNGYETQEHIIPYEEEEDMETWD